MTILSEKQAATMMGISERTLQRLRESGNGPSYVRMSARRIGYMETELERWLEQRTFSHMAAELASKSRCRPTIQ